MDIKARRRKRVTILILIVLLSGGAIVGLVFYQKAKRQQQALEALAVGMAAYEKGDYPAAIASLDEYLKRTGDEADPERRAEAYYAFAKSHLQVPQPSSRHMAYALMALNKTAKLDPQNADALHELLQLQLAVGQNDEAMQTADKLLAIDANDIEGLKARAIVLARQEKHADALEAARKVIALDETNYQMQLLALQLRKHVGDGPNQIVGDTEALLNKHPDDPRFEMLLGYAHALAGNGAESARALRSAAQRPMPDDAFAYMLVQVLDTANLFDESLGVCTRNATTDVDSPLFLETPRRLFENGRFDELAERFASLDAADEATPVEAVALRAMALYQSGRREEASALIKALAGRSTSATAAHWAKVLDQVYAREFRQVPEVIKACNEALAAMPGNAYVHAFLGDAYASIGDSELAMTSWRKAADLRPSWAGVRSLIARTLLASGRTDEALDFAQAALVRQPGSIDAAVTVIRARAAKVRPGDTATARELLKAIEEVQRVAPQETQTHLIRVAMLAELGDKNGARESINRLLANDSIELTQAMLLQLAATSEKHGLGMEDALLAHIEGSVGSTPELALARASQMADEGKVDEGLKLLQDAQAAATTGQDQEWQFAIAMYMDRVGHPRAEETWIALADRFPDNAQLQRLALRARSTQGNREFSGRVIDRLGKLMGEDSVSWRLDRARWLLESPNVEQDSAAAVALLRQVVADAPKRPEPRLLLARGLEQMNRVSLAIQELRSAEAQIPAHVPMQLELARLHQIERQFPTAKDYLEQVAHNPSATPAEKRDAALLLARQGESVRAIQLLEASGATADAADPNDRLLLANLYQRSGKTQQAEAILKDVLESDPNPTAFALALELYGAMGRTADVNRVLQQLDASSLSEADKQRVLAEFHARGGDREEALKLYEATANASPTDARLWRQLAAFQLMAGHGDRAVAAAERGLTHVPDEPALAHVRANAEAIKAYASNETLRPLLALLASDDPAVRQIASEGVAAVKQHIRGERITPELAKRMRELADKRQDLLSLQMVAARAHLRAGQPRDAELVASRAAQVFPTSVEPAWLLAEAMASRGDWVAVLGAATEWRNRTTGSTLNPDMMFAEAKLQLGEPQGAMEKIQPYLTQALAKPDDFREVVTRYARALIMLKRYDEASRVMGPHLHKDPYWRITAVQMAANGIDNQAAALRWLDQITQATPADSVEERLAVAQAWWAASQRFSATALRDRAQQLIDDLTSRPDATAAAWYLKGVLFETAGDPARAEPAYREALKRDPDLAVAQNNLAMLLAQRDSDKSEALRLASAAVKLIPNEANFLDTLAFVQASAGQFDEAINTINQAIKLDPENAEWKRSLANILKQAGRDEEAEQVLQNIPRQLGQR